VSRGDGPAVRLEVRCCCDAGRMVGWVDVPYAELSAAIARRRVTLRQFATSVQAAFARIEEHNGNAISPPRTHQATLTFEVEELVNTSSWGPERYYAVKSHDVPLDELMRVPNFRPARPADIARVTPHNLPRGMSGSQVTGVIFDELENTGDSPQRHCSLVDGIQRNALSYLVENREVDESRIVELTTAQLHDPLIFVLCPAGTNGEGESHLLVDGIHRLVARYRRGYEDFLFRMVPWDRAQRIDPDDFTNIEWGDKELVPGVGLVDRRTK
jgi:hypothetical protein